MNASDKNFDKAFLGEKIDKPLDGMYLYDVPSISSDEIEESIRKMKEFFDK